MILNLLQQQGISGRIEGEYLQGGVGELQAMGFVRVVVSEGDYARARRVIEEWEALEPHVEEINREPVACGGLQIFVVGVVVGAWLMYWILKGPG